MPLGSNEQCDFQKMNIPQSMYMFYYTIKLILRRLPNLILNVKKKD